MARIVVEALRTLDRCNARHPWSHNDAYRPLILAHGRRLPSRSRALDVGCGTGNLLRALAPLFDEVVGIEVDRATAEGARRRTRDLSNVAVVAGDLVSSVQHGYDLVTAVAVLHHVPLQEGLLRLRECVAPGGRLVIVGVHRETRRDAPLSLLSTLLNPVVGCIVHPAVAESLPPQMTAPVREPRETLAQIAAAARRELPGVRIRRGLLWRHTATWVAPDGAAGARGNGS